MADNFDIPAAEGVDGDFELPEDANYLKVGEEKEIGDHGLKKKLVKEGEGWDTPDYGDEVQVKYEARLEDGTVVAKSDGIEFTVQEGHFCLALSTAVKTMKKGEKVLLTVKPQYGFGEKGKPASGDQGAVPPNATLDIDLELVSWKTVSNVTDDKKVIKKILKEGDGYERPNEGAVVKLKLIGKLQDDTVFVKKGHGDDENDLFEFKTDEEQVIDGLDKAVATMKKGEVALLTISPEYAFGSSESQQELAKVPPNSTVFYEVELVSFDKERESWDMNDEEKIEAAGVSMTLLVSFMNGDRCTVKVGIFETVGDVKKKVNQRLDKEPDQQMRFLFRGRALDDAMNMLDCGIEKESCFQAFFLDDESSGSGAGGEGGGTNTAA